MSLNRGKLKPTYDITPLGLIFRLFELLRHTVPAVQALVLKNDQEGNKNQMVEISLSNEIPDLLYIKSALHQTSSRLMQNWVSAGLPAAGAQVTTCLWILILCQHVVAMLNVQSDLTTSSCGIMQCILTLHVQSLKFITIDMLLVHIRAKAGPFACFVPALWLLLSSAGHCACGLSTSMPKVMLQMPKRQGCCDCNLGIQFCPPLKDISSFCFIQT